MRHGVRPPRSGQGAALPCLLPPTRPAVRHDLRKRGAHGADDVLGHPFDRALRDAHLPAHDFVDREVVHRLFHRVFAGRVAQLGPDLQIDRETVAHALFEVVAPVVRTELHAFENDAVLHGYSAVTR